MCIVICVFVLLQFPAPDTGDYFVKLRCDRTKPLCVSLEL